ncbi:MAG: phosphoenolpyruvate carboxykinase (ATP) [Sumerlaeia bacterium]
MHFDLSQYGVTAEKIHRNPPVGRLYELGLEEKGTTFSSTGAMIAYSGAKTGRSPEDKRVVREADSEGNIWWGSVNRPICEKSFAFNREIALNFLASRHRVFVIDGYAGWDPRYRIKVRVICSRAYHALFMHNMLIRPTKEELANFGEPDWVIYNAGQMGASTQVENVDTKTSVALSFKNREFVILGTEYAGEMKKGVFTVLNYILPLQGVLSMHCSANEGGDGDTALFFGLSGTGKTTLSADPKRALIGDDEHGWSDRGIFNFEGGCYAKTINLSREGEPQIYDAIKFGSILENVVYDPFSHDVDYTDTRFTQNTRCSYPVEFIDNAKIPCVGGHPKNVIFLTCDAFGVLPPVAKLTPGQAMYHFISGYTAKVAGTEVGVTEPKATFSACFGAAFLVWHPAKYAEMLAEKMRAHGSTVWLVNTGWSGGPAADMFGVKASKRMKLAYTRSIVDAILNGELDHAEYQTDEVFGLATPKSLAGVPDEILNPRMAWPDKNSYDLAAGKLAEMFTKNFEKYASEASAEILEAAPKIPAAS